VSAAELFGERRVDAGRSAEHPDVTFLVAAFNVAAFIEEAVCSALGQKGVSVEVIVVDDASSDGTADVVERLAAADSRVVLIKQNRNAGPGAARNAALKRARGRWIAVLDGDDYVLPERASTLLACAEATGGDIVGDNFERVSIDGKPTGRLLFPPARVPYLFTVDAPTFIVANQMLGSNKFSLSAIKVMIRSEFLKSHAVLHAEDLPVGEDFQFILSCLFRGARFIVTSESGYKYRIRPGSQSWRLTDDHMEKLGFAYASVLHDARQVGDPLAIDAAIAYGRSLRRASDFVRAVSLAKIGSWEKAMLWAVIRPSTWPLVIRYGSQAVFNRLQRLVLRTSLG
jgi:succinoglycan biosynthesis protein ExoO